MSDKNTNPPCILVKISNAVWKFNDAFFFEKETQRLTLDHTILPSKPGIIVRTRRQTHRRVNKTLFVLCKVNFFTLLTGPKNIEEHIAERQTETCSFFERPRV